MLNNNLPVGTSALILTKIDNISYFALTKRGNGCRSLRGKWSLPGGGVEINEHPFDCVKRETLEEVNLHIIPFKRLPILMLDGDDQLWMDVPYICFLDPSKSTFKDLKNNEPHKFDEVDWFSFNTPPDDLAVLGMHIINYVKNNFDIDNLFLSEKDLLDMSFRSTFVSSLDIHCIYERSKEE